MAGAITATNGVGVKVEDTKIVVVMVGLPARGKSLIAQKSKLDLKSIEWVAWFMLHGTRRDFLRANKKVCR